jgi:hypothetical protein
MPVIMEGISGYAEGQTVPFPVEKSAYTRRGAEICPVS